MQAHRCVVGGDAEARGRLWNGRITEVDEGEHRLVPRGQLTNERGAAAARLVDHREGRLAGFGGQLLPSRSTGARPCLVDDDVLDQPVQPRERTLRIVQMLGTLDGSDARGVQQVLDIGTGSSGPYEGLELPVMSRERSRNDLSMRGGHESPAYRRTERALVCCELGRHARPVAPGQPHEDGHGQSSPQVQVAPQQQPPSTGATCSHLHVLGSHWRHRHRSSVVMGSSSRNARSGTVAG